VPQNRQRASPELEVTLLSIAVVSVFTPQGGKLRAFLPEVFEPVQVISRELISIPRTTLLMDELNGGRDGYHDIMDQLWEKSK
jgi:hypothetical protein